MKTSMNKSSVLTEDVTFSIGHIYELLGVSNVTCLLDCDMQVKVGFCSDCPNEYGCFYTLFLCLSGRWGSLTCDVKRSFNVELILDPDQHINTPHKDKSDTNFNSRKYNHDDSMPKIEKQNILKRTTRSSDDLLQYIIKIFTVLFASVPDRPTKTDKEIKYILNDITDPCKTFKKEPNWYKNLEQILYYSKREAKGHRRKKGTDFSRSNENRYSNRVGLGDGESSVTRSNIDSLSHEISNGVEVEKGEQRSTPLATVDERKLFKAEEIEKDDTFDFCKSNETHRDLSLDRQVLENLDENTDASEFSSTKSADVPPQTKETSDLSDGGEREKHLTSTEEEVGCVTGNIRDSGCDVARNVHRELHAQTEQSDFYNGGGNESSLTSIDMVIEHAGGNTSGIDCSYARCVDRLLHAKETSVISNGDRCDRDLETSEEVDGRVGGKDYEDNCNIQRCQSQEPNNLERANAYCDEVNQDSRSIEGTYNAESEVVEGFQCDGDINSSDFARGLPRETQKMETANRNRISQADVVEPEYTEADSALPDDPAEMLERSEDHGTFESEQDSNMKMLKAVCLKNMSWGSESVRRPETESRGMFSQGKELTGLHGQRNEIENLKALTKRVKCDENASSLSEGMRKIFDIRNSTLPSLERQNMFSSKPVFLKDDCMRPDTPVDTVFKTLYRHTDYIPWHLNIDMRAASGFPVIGIPWKDFERETMRIASYAFYPTNAAKSPSELAKWGFVYTGDDGSDKVTCFSCKMEKENWKEDDDIEGIHRFLSPTCPMVDVMTPNNVSETAVGETEIPGPASSGLTTQHEVASDKVTTAVKTPSSSAEYSSSITSSTSTNSSSSSGDSSERANDLDTDCGNSPSLQNQQVNSNGTTHHHPETNTTTQQRHHHHHHHHHHQQNHNHRHHSSSSVSAPEKLQERREAAQNGSSAQRPNHPTINSQIYAIPSRPRTTEGQTSSSSTTTDSTDTNRPPMPPNMNYQDLGIFYERPKHPHYAIQLNRLQTYDGWPEHHHLKPDDLVRAGMFYAGYADSCKCFFCGGGLRRWDQGDDPFVEHARWFPKCGYINQYMGKKFVEAVQELKSKGGTITLSQVKKHMEKNGLPLHSEFDEMPVEEDAAVRSFVDEGYDKAKVYAVARELRENGESLSAELIYAKLNQPTPQNSSGANGAEGANGATPLVSNAKQSKKPNDPVQELKAQNYMLRNNLTCKICMDKEVKMVFLPCGHLVSCQECAVALQDCPVCRRHIRATVRANIR